MGLNHKLALQVSDKALDQGADIDERDGIHTLELKDNYAQFTWWICYYMYAMDYAVSTIVTQEEGMVTPFRALQSLSILPSHRLYILTLTTVSRK